MKYSVDQTVNIAVADQDAYVIGEVMSIDTTTFAGTIYWVRYEHHGPQISCFFESDLNRWNNPQEVCKCSCGATKLNHPGHSYYCGLYENS